MHTSLKKRGVALLLIPAFLIVCVALILPTVSSADPVEIDDFSYQTLATLDLLKDEKTDLRFLFTVGSLGYDEVGFVFSKTNADPTIGGAKCVKASTTTVYGAVTADGVPEPAPHGRWWVAIKLVNVPRDYFDGTLYVRPFVTGGGETRYGGAVSFTVSSAAGHVHVWGEWETVREASCLLGDGLERRRCENCSAVDRRAIGYEGDALEAQTFLSDGEESCENKKTLKEIMGDRHFYPTPENLAGNDLLIEYSLLWNETLLNLDGEEDPYVTALFGNWNGGDANVLTYFSPTDEIENSWCKYAGGFEAAGEFRTVSSAGAAYTPEGMNGEGGVFSDYPNIGGSDPLDPEWGWHRVGIRFHQEVSNVEAVKGGAEATYLYVVTTYVDGEPVSMLEGTEVSIDKNHLFTAASDGEGGIVYSDNANLGGGNSKKRTVFAFRFNATFTEPDTAAYWMYADVFYTCGAEFAQNVEKNASPAAATVELGGSEYSAKIWYQLAD